MTICQRACGCRGVQLMARSLKSQTGIDSLQPKILSSGSQKVVNLVWRRCARRHACAMVEKLNVEINRVLSLPELGDARLAPQALVPMSMSVREFGDFMARDRRNAAEIVKLSGIAPQ
jgi:hypothetical protein